MKTLLCLMLMACACCGQTIKWENAVPDPGISFEKSYEAGGKTDAIGTMAAIIGYQDAGLQFIGSQVLWYTNTGKLIKSDVLGSNDGVWVVFVSPAILVIQVTNGNDSYFRKYVRKGVSVVSKDTPLTGGAAEYSPSSGTFDNSDKLGFFVFSRSQSLKTVTGIKRYLR